MNAKRASVRLFVATTGLVASLFELAEAFVRLVTAFVERLTRALRGPTSPQDMTRAMTLAPTVVAPTPAPAAPAVTRMTVAMTENERLTAALMSLKFPAAKVRAFVASVGDRQAPLEVLVKEGIVALTAN